MAIARWREARDFYVAAWRSRRGEPCRFSSCGFIRAWADGRQLSASSIRESRILPPRPPGHIHRQTCRQPDSFTSSSFFSPVIRYCSGVYAHARMLVFILISNYPPPQTFHRGGAGFSAQNPRFSITECPFSLFLYRSSAREPKRALPPG